MSKKADEVRAWLKNRQLKAKFSFRCDGDTIHVYRQSVVVKNADTHLFDILIEDVAEFVAALQHEIAGPLGKQILEMEKRDE